MKILNRTEFMKQPTGILYRKGLPDREFSEIEIKGDNCGNVDFACMDFGYVESDYETDFFLDDTVSRPVTIDCYGRDGLFERDAVFLVYETWDLEQLRGVIDYAITVAPKQVFENPW